MVGFCLIVSHQGRGVIDCISGSRVAHDPHEGPGWFDESGPEATGIGPLAEEQVPVVGLAGGSLAQATTDGWRVSLNTAGVLVHAPDGQDPGASFTVEESEELRAWGFSPDGLTLVAGASPGLAIYRREYLDRLDRGQPICRSVDGPTARPPQESARPAAANAVQRCPS
jgi:hypothetical protein